MKYTVLFALVLFCFMGTNAYAITDDENDVVYKVLDGIKTLCDTEFPDDATKSQDCFRKQGRAMLEYTNTLAKVGASGDKTKIRALGFCAMKWTKDMEKEIIDYVMLLQCYDEQTEVEKNNTTE